MTKSLKQVDMSCLVGSQVLCRDEVGSIGSLVEFQRDERRPFIFKNAEGDTWANRYCRIYTHPDYWIDHANALSLPVGLKVRGCDYVGDQVFESSIGINDYLYDENGDTGNSIADLNFWQVTGLADGYTWSDV